MGEIRGSWIAAGGAEWRRLRARCTSKIHAEYLIFYVPYRLIRPFFAAETRGLLDHKVNPAVAVLAEKYFQPGIVEKLEPPMARASLARQTLWWKAALPRLAEPARCIFSGKPLDASALSLDHFLPWSLVAHDRLWNLIPVSCSVNSTKSDRLPAPRYLEGLVRTQHAALSVLRKAWSESRWNAAVEPWLVDMSLSKDALLDRTKLGAAYEATMTPLMLIGGRQGFMKGWEYR